MSRRSESARDPVQAPLEKPVSRLIEPFQGFVDSQSGSGWLLLSATVLALVVANSPWAEGYFDARSVELGLAFAGSTAVLTVEHWVNDGLMALFFLLLGLELKREFLVGQLSRPGQAASVLTAAAGGMVLPAAFFLLAVDDSALRQAWAVPMATDTAFALMILVFLRDRVPLQVRATQILFLQVEAFLMAAAPIDTRLRAVIAPSGGWARQKRQSQKARQDWQADAQGCAASHEFHLKNSPLLG